MTAQKIRETIESIKQGQTLTHGSLSIRYYDTHRETFLVEKFYNGTSAREELSMTGVRQILQDMY